MSLVEHAKRELSLIKEDQELIDNLVAVVDEFAEFGHSGGSAPFAISYLERLLRFEPLSPLTSNPNEWLDRSEMSGTPMWQSVRDSRAFSKDGGKTWTLLGEDSPADTVDQVSVRMTALDFAIRSEMPASTATPPDANRVIDRAKQYRAFLEGEA